MGVTLAAVKDTVDIGSSVITAAGIVIGGFIAWRKWGRMAPLARRAALSHNVVHHLLSPAHRLVHVSLDIRNTGTVTIMPFKAYSFIQRVSPVGDDFTERIRLGQVPMDPVTKTEYDWPRIGWQDYPLGEGHMPIDSDESDHLECEFIIPASVSAAFVYTCVFLDPKKPDLGWDITTFHLFGTEPKTDQKEGPAEAADA